MGVGCYTPENNNTSGRNISNKIPLDQYICPECGKVPELISFYSDNGLIQFKCKDKEHKIMKVEDYMVALNNSKFNYFNDSCSKCKKIQHKEIRNGIFSYCYDCQKKFCPTHKNKWDEQHTELHDKMCLINQLTERCDIHFDEGKYDQFCLDCQENICKNYSDKIHFKHSIKNFSDDKNLLEESKEIIRKKNRQLNAIMEFNNLILNTYEKHPNNYFHIINLINLAKLIEKEDERDPRELENALIEIKNYMKNSEKAIDDFNIKYQTMITNKETRLILRHKNLEDIIFEEIREMSLYHLQELDLSFNKIKNIDYLKYMFLSFLEYLGLNDNKIEDIKAISQINFRELKLLNLQNNNIKNANYLTKAEMPKIEMIRIDGNRAIKNLEEAINKYTNKKLVTIPLTFEDFGKKYNLTKLLTKNSIRFELNGNDKGDEILRDLYLILPNDNEINYLILTNCRIKSIRLLSKIPFPKLENINLSFNNIICIDAISELRNKYLKELYLQENYICNITPLLKTKFDRNAKIDIRNNNLIKSHDDSEKIVNNLKRRNFTVEVNYRDKEKKIE